MPNWCTSLTHALVSLLLANAELTSIDQRNAHGSSHDSHSSSTFGSDLGVKAGLVDKELHFLAERQSGNKTHYWEVARSRADYGHELFYANEAQLSEQNGHTVAHGHGYSGSEYSEGVLLIAFMLAVAMLNYAIYHENHHVRRVSWLLVHGSTSVFLAVFTFQVVNSYVGIEAFAVFGYHVDEENEEIVEAKFSIFSSSLWYVVMVIFLSVAARIGRGPEARHEIAHNKGWLTRLTAKMTSFTFMAHAAAFSRIEGLILTLNSEKYEHSLQACAILTLWVMVQSILILHVLGLTRSAFLTYALRDAEHDHLVEEWVECLEEGENDLFALISSFLISNLILFHITGRQVFNNSGHESIEHQFTHPKGEAFNAYVWAFAFLLVGFVYGMFVAFVNRGIDDEREEREMEESLPSHEFSAASTTSTGRRLALAAADKIGFLVRILKTMATKRVRPVLQNTLVMTFSWLFLYATQWWIASCYVAGHSLTGHNRTTLNLMVTGIVATFAFTFVIVCTKISDCLVERCPRMETFAILVSRALRSLMLGMGFLVGFSGEQTYVHAINAVVWHVHDLSHGQLDKHLTTLFLFVISFGVVYPTWCGFIIPQHREKGYLFGFVPRLTHGFVKRVLEKNDVDLPEQEKVKFLEASLVLLAKSLSPEEREKLAGVLRGYQAPAH